MKSIYLLLTCILFWFPTCPLWAQASVFINQVVEHPALNVTRQGIYDTLASSPYTREVKWSYECAQGNPAMALQIAQKAVGKKSTIMVGIGTTSAQALKQASKNSSQSAIIFASVTDPVGSGLVDDLSSPKGAVTGVSNFVSIEPQLSFFKKIQPDLKRLGVIYNPSEANSVTLIARLKVVAASMGLEVLEVTASKTAEVGPAALALFPKVDAIYITNDNTALAAFRSIVRVGLEVGKPVYCSDVDMVEQGALAAMGPDQYTIGCQVGRQIVRFLEGTPLVEIPVEFPDESLQYINTSIANKLKINIQASVLEQARLVSLL